MHNCHPEARLAGREDPVLTDECKTLVERFLDGRVATLLTMTVFINLSYNSLSINSVISRPLKAFFHIESLMIFWAVIKNAEHLIFLF